jgi:hypothetical protein
MNNNSVTTPNFVNSQISSNDIVAYGLKEAAEGDRDTNITITSRGIYTAYMWPVPSDASAIVRNSGIYTFYVAPGTAPGRAYTDIYRNTGEGSEIYFPSDNGSLLRFTGSTIGDGSGRLQWYYYLLQKICSLNLT